MSKIEQIIAEIEEYIDSCKFQPLSNTKIVVNRDEIEEMIDDLKRNVPEEIQRYQRIIANRDVILKDAQDKADDMINKANEMTVSLVSEHEIMQKAYVEANSVIEDANVQAGRILDQAQSEANDIREAATQYLDNAMENIQNILNSSIEGLTMRYDESIRLLQGNMDKITTDRRTLHQSVYMNGQSSASDDAGFVREDAAYDQEPVFGSNNR